jgi:hypothetical protein
MSYLPGWTNVRLRGMDIGFVYVAPSGLWVAVVERNGETGKDAGHAETKADAIKLVKAAYLRS